MSREVRRVPITWQHPKDKNGRYVPLFDGFGRAAARWDKNSAEWDAGTHEDLTMDPQRKAKYPRWEDWCGKRPEPENYMPDWPDEQRTHLMLYETCTEGTPISPVFETLDELCAYAAEHCSTFAYFKASAEEWKSMLDRGHVFYREGNMIFC